MHVSCAQIFRRAAIIASSAVLLTPPLFSGTHAVADPGGDIKVHEANTPADDQSNEPKVCSPFFIQAFNETDGFALVYTIEIQGGPHNKEEVGPHFTHFPGVVVNGQATSSAVNLPPDHYKVTVHEYNPQTGDETQVPANDPDAKTKVFKVECSAPTPTPTPTPTTTPTPTPTPVVPTPTPVVPTPTPVVPTPTPVVPTPTPVVPTPTPVVEPTPTPGVGGVVKPTPKPKPTATPKPKPHRTTCPGDEVGVNAVQKMSCPAVEGEVVPPAEDDDNGGTPVGGVSTGGGALAAGSSSSPVGTNSVAATVLLSMGGWSAVERLRRRKG
jgi:hypothetical protein